MGIITILTLPGFAFLVFMNNVLLKPFEMLKIIIIVLWITKIIHCSLKDCGEFGNTYISTMRTYTRIINVWTRFRYFWTTWTVLLGRVRQQFFEFDKILNFLSVDMKGYFFEDQVCIPKGFIGGLISEVFLIQDGPSIISKLWNSFELY